MPNISRRKFLKNMVAGIAILASIKTLPFAKSPTFFVDKDGNATIKGMKFDVDKENNAILK